MASVRTCAYPNCEEQFECAHNSSRRYCDKHLGGHEAADDSEASRTEALRIERIMDENRTLRAALQRSRKDEIRAEEIREKCYELAGVSPNPPAWLYEPTKGGTPGVPLTTWSDWHAGEVVNPTEVGYVNDFNTEILRERVRTLVQTTLDLSFKHMINPQYPGIVVNLAGDMITGDIHEELEITNDRYTFQSLLDLQDIIVPGLTLFADHFGKVFVPCVVGNHGRNTQKPRMKGRAFTSFEWHLYNQLERYFQNDDRVQFLVSNEADAHYRVYNHRYLLTHGDSLGVKGGDGIIGSLGPIMRGAIKVGRAESQIGRDFDTLIMGHWHQWISLRGIEVNGSLKGYDEYARLGLRAAFERPTQALWFQDHKWGMTAKWPIYLSEKPVPDNLPWVSWQDA